MKTKSIKIFEKKDVEQITLLTIEQAEKIPTNILVCDNWCWLRSPGDDQYYAARVSDDGGIFGYGSYVDYDDGAVRPAFKITNFNLEIGEKVFVENISCTAIDKNLILADGCACCYPFDTESNNWKTSKLKKFIESDYFWNKYIEKERG